MGLLKWILTKFSCKSSCMFNAENEIFDRASMSQPLSRYELKFKDLKTIMKILNKRKIIKYPVSNILV